MKYIIILFAVFALSPYGITGEAIQIGDNPTRRTGEVFLEGNGYPPDYYCALFIIDGFDASQLETYYEAAISKIRKYDNPDGRKYLVLCIVDLQTKSNTGGNHRHGIILKATDVKNDRLDESQVYKAALFASNTPFRYRKDSATREWLIISEYSIHVDKK